MKKSVIAGVAVLSAFANTAANAADLTIKVTNLTQGIYFTPILVAAHGNDSSLFEVGQAASPELQAMAEGGAIGGLADLVTAASGDSVSNPAEGLLMPGASTEASLMTADGNTHLSVVAMLLPTNDGFVGLDNWQIPTEAGTYTVYLNGYDAGTEANDEIVNGGGAPGAPGIPVNPGANGGTNGTGVTSTEENATVHIHRGNLGDSDAEGGASDLNSSVHRWLNPVAKVTVTVQ